jgi:hypothetical protein
MISMADVSNLEFDQIASPELTVKTQVKHGQFPDPVFELQSHAYGPDSFSLNGAFWPTSLPLFHGSWWDLLLESSMLDSLKLKGIQLSC